MPRQLQNIDFALTTEVHPDGPAYLHKVAPNHPLQRYIMAMAKRMELDCTLSLYIDGTRGIRAGSILNIGKKHNIILLGEDVLKKCSSRMTAWALAHEMGHFTPEAHPVTIHPRQRESVADAWSDIVTPPGTAILALQELTNRLPLHDRFCNLMGTPHYPSLGYRVLNVACRTWHQTCLNGVKERRNEREAAKVRLAEAQTRG
jgi:hypothetical protein